MERSRYFEKKIGKVFKANYDKDISSFANQFPTLFIESFNEVPVDMASELYHKFVTYSDREFKEALYNLVNVLELFEENYDMENDPLLEEEWEYIKLLINTGSDELELEIIQYIMQVMLDLNYM